MEATSQVVEDHESTEEMAPKNRQFDFIRRRRRHLFAALESELGRARAEVPALSRYETVAEAVKVLRRGSTDPDKIVLTEALLGQVRLGRAALANLLVFGYLPMLEYLLRFGSTHITDDDLRESMALEAFSKAIADYRGALANPCRFLQKATLRGLRRAVRRYRREQSRIDLVSIEELDQNQDVRWESKLSAGEVSVGIRASLAEDSEELTTLLRKEVDGRISPDRLELVEATVLRGEDLASFVKRKFPEQSGEERAQTYGRLQRQRNRIVHALREILGPWRARLLAEETPGRRAGLGAGRAAATSCPCPSPSPR